jgi:hypothetical protein
MLCQSLAELNISASQACESYGQSTSLENARDAFERGDGDQAMLGTSDISRRREVVDSRSRRSWLPDAGISANEGEGKVPEKDLRAKRGEIEARITVESHSLRVGS